MLENKLGRMLALTSRAHCNMGNRTFPQLGLHRGQVVVLMELGFQDGLTQSELAEKTEVTPATMTNLLQRMQEAGFINRQRDPIDTRVSHVFLSEMGKSVLAQVQGLAREIDQKAFAGFSPAEQEQLYQFFERIHANLTEQS